MKTITWLASDKVGAVLMTVILFSLAASAQPTPDRPRHPLPPPDPLRGERRQMPEPRPIFGVLNEEQRAELREITEANREHRQELERKTRAARRELDEAVFAEKFNERTVRKKAKAVAALEAERITMRAKTFARLRPSLTPEQIERIKERRAEFGAGFGGLRAGRPLAPHRFLGREGRFAGPEPRRPEERFDEQERFRPEARPEDPRAPRPEARLRQPPLGRPERRFSEPHHHEGEIRPPRFRDDDFDRGRPEFRSEERGPRPPEPRRDDFRHEREVGPPDYRERRRPERPDEGEPRPRKRSEPTPESQPENLERERGEASPPPGSEPR